MPVVSPLRFDESTFYGVKKVNVTGKIFYTPKKTANLENLRGDILLHAEFLGEIYKAFGKERIQSLISDEEKQVKFNYELNTSQKRARHLPVQVMLFIPALTYSNPSENELSFILSTQEHYSDFYVVPTVEHLSKLMKDTTFSIHDYVTLIEQYLNMLGEYQQKVVMGMVPINIPFQYIETLMNIYLKN